MPQIETRASDEAVTAELAEFASELSRAAVTFATEGLSVTVCMRNDSAEGWRFTARFVKHRYERTSAPEWWFSSTVDYLAGLNPRYRRDLAGAVLRDMCLALGLDKDRLR